MDMDVFAEVVDDEAFAIPFQFARVTTARSRDGAIESAAAWQVVRGVVQPASGQATKHLTEGERTLPAIKVWAGQALNPTFGDLPQLGDLINWHGRNYRVVEPRDWSQYGYWQALAVEVRSG